MDKRFYPKQDFVDLEKDHMEKNDLTLTVGIDIFYVEATWDGGEYSGAIAMSSRYGIFDENGTLVRPWFMDENIFEYLCGKPPVDALDEIKLKEYFVEERLMPEFTNLRGTYNKNLKIHKLERQYIPDFVEK